MNLFPSEAELARSKPLFSQEGFLAGGYRREQSWSEATLGVMAYTAVDMLRSVEARLAHLTGEKPGTVLQGWLERHVNWAPPQPESVGELITSPKELVGEIAAQVPFIAGIMATGAAGGAPGALAKAPKLEALGRFLAPFLFTYAIEGQAAYERALMNGATEKQAETAANIIGPIASMIMTTAVGRLGSIGKRVMEPIKRRAIEEGLSAAAKFGLVGASLGQEIAAISFQQAMRGTVHDVGALQIYGQPIKWKDFWDQRAQETVAIGATTALFGLGRYAFAKVGVTQEQASQLLDPKRSTVPKDVKSGLMEMLEPFDKEFSEKTKAPRGTYANAVVRLVDSAARTWAKRENRPVEDYYKERFATEWTEDQIKNGVMLEQPRKVASYFLKVEQLLTDPKVLKQKSTIAQWKNFFKARGIKDAELEWIGMDEMLREIPGESITGEQLLDTISTTGLKLERVMLTEEGDQRLFEQVQSLRQQRSDLMQELLGKVREVWRTYTKARNSPRDSEEYRKHQEEIARLNEEMERINGEIAGLAERIDEQLNIAESSKTQYHGLVSFTAPGERTNYREHLIKIKNPRGEFYADHFPRFAHDTGLVMWLRTTDRIIDGKRTLFVEEIQSDVFQRARKKIHGMDPMEIMEKVEHDPLNDSEAKEPLRELGFEVTSFDRESSTIHFTYKGKEYSVNVHPLEETDNKLYTLLYNYAIKPAVDAAVDPDIPFPDFVVLGLKEALRLAAAEGYEQVTWSSGTEQVMRNYFSFSSAQGRGTMNAYNILVPTKMKKLLKKLGVKWEPKTKEQPKREEFVVVEDALVLARPGLNQIRVKTDNGTWTLIRFRNGEVVGRLKREDEHYYGSLGKMSEEEFERLKVPGARFEASVKNRFADNYFVPITPELTEKINSEGFSLFQDARGKVVFLPDGRAVIQAVKNPDASTALHELAHVFRKDLKGIDLEIASEWVGAKPGETWSKVHEERFAKGFEAWLREGRAPSQNLVSVFKRFAEWLKGVYRTLRSVGLHRELSEEMRGVFDRIFWEDGTEVADARRELIRLKANFKKDLESAKAQSAIGALSTEEVSKKAYELWEKAGRPNGMSNEFWFQAQAELVESKAKKQLLEQIRAANEKLAQLMRLRYDPTKPLTESIANDEAVKGLLESESSMDTVRRTELRHAAESVGSWIQQAFPLKRTSAGRILLARLSEAETLVRSIRGTFENRIADVMKRLTLKERQWLMRPDEKGYSGIRKLTDQTGSLENVDPTSQALADLRALLWDIQNTLAHEAVRVGVLRRMDDGSTVPFKPSKYQKLSRIPTDHAWTAIQDGQGPLWEAIVEAVKRDNPDLSLPTIKKSLKEWLRGHPVKKSGALEEVRRIRYMPDYVKVGGKWVTLFHTEPYSVLTKTIEYQARRIAFVEQFGHTQRLKNISFKTLSSVARLLGVKTHITKAELVEELYQNGVVFEREPGSMSMKALRALAKEAGVATQITKDKLLERLDKVDPETIDSAKRKKLKALAKRLGGIPLDRDFEEIFIDLKSRAKAPVVDLVTKLIEIHHLEGGSLYDIENVLRVWQGLPYHWLNRRMGWRLARFMSEVIGAGQTSLSVAPNIPQPLSLIPKFTGWGRLAEARENFLKHPNTTRSQLAALGAFYRVVYHWGLERGYWLEGIGRNIRQTVGLLTGLQYVSERNNIIAGEAFRIMADDWRANGLQKGDIAVAKELGLSPKEIELAKKGEISDLTYKKIIYSGVAKTQFVSESRHLRGKIENIPIANMLFAYANYTLGQTRAVVRFFANDIGPALKAAAKGDVSLIPSATKHLFAFLAGNVGAGVAAALLRQGLKGRWRPMDSQDAQDLALAGLLEVQLFGAAQRMIEPFKYDQGVAEKALVGLMPKVSAVVDLFSTLLGYGKYGKFELGERLEKHIQRTTPIVKAGFEWADKIAWPKQGEYFEVKYRTGKYKRMLVKKGLRSKSYLEQTQLQPDYYRIFEYVRRFDFDGARDEAQVYVQRELDKGRPLSKILQGLRASLIARAPIYLGTKDWIGFMKSLDPKTRERYMQIQGRYMRIVNLIAP